MIDTAASYLAPHSCIRRCLRKNLIAACFWVLPAFG
jgi:hypothetical protein